MADAEPTREQMIAELRAPSEPSRAEMIAALRTPDKQSSDDQPYFGPGGKVPQWMNENPSVKAGLHSGTDQLPLAGMAVGGAAGAAAGAAGPQAVTGAPVLLGMAGGMLGGAMGSQAKDMLNDRLFGEQKSMQARGDSATTVSY